MRSTLFVLHARRGDLLHCHHVVLAFGSFFIQARLALEPLPHIIFQS